MIKEHHGFDRVVILCDESANWQIAGLRQLDRLVLGLDEFAKAMGTPNKIEIVVFWKPEIPLSERLLPKHQRNPLVRLELPYPSPRRLDMTSLSAIATPMAIGFALNCFRG